MSSPPDDSTSGFAAPAAPAVEPVPATVGTVPVPAGAPVAPHAPLSITSALDAGPVPLAKLGSPPPPPTDVTLDVVEFGEDLPDVLQASGEVATPPAPTVDPAPAAVDAVPPPSTTPAALPVAATDGLTSEPAPLATPQPLPLPLTAPRLTGRPVTLELGEHLASVLQTLDQPLERTARELIVLELYRQGRTPRDKAAEILGESTADFITRLSDLGINEDTSAACLSGLTSVLDTVREDLRSLRLLFASNLILAFSIPIATLAIANRYVFFVERLPVRLFKFSISLPFDAQAVFWAWVTATLCFGYGIFHLLLKNKSENLADSAVLQATKALARNDIAVATRKLATAVDFYIDSASETFKARWPFLITFALFVICIGIEFALCVFSPLPKA